MGVVVASGFDPPGELGRSLDLANGGHVRAEGGENCLYLGDEWLLICVEQAPRIHSPCSSSKLGWQQIGYFVYEDAMLGGRSVLRVESRAVVALQSATIDSTRS